jgi:hypothetical protein
MRRRAAIASILCAWIFSFPLSGDTFALRGLGKGDRVPDLTFVGITAESGKLSSFSGEKGLIVIYWATWSSRTPTTRRCAGRKSKRSRERQRRWPSRSR